MMKNTKFRRILLLLACAVLLVSLSVGATLAYLTSTADVENTFTVGKVEIELDEAQVDKETGKAIEGAERTKTGNTEVRMVPGRLIDKDPTVTVLAGSEDCYVRVKVTVTVPNWKKSATGEPVIDPDTGEEMIDTETGEVILGEPATFEEWATRLALNYILTRYETGIDDAGFNRNNWNVGATPIIDSENKTVTYVLNYKDNDRNIVEKNMDSNTGLPVDTVLPAVFTHIHVPAKLDKDDLAKLAGMSIKVVAEAIQAEGFENENPQIAEMNAWYAFDGKN